MKNIGKGKGKRTPKHPNGLPGKTPWMAAGLGGALGLAAAILWFAPAAWLASALLSATDGRVILASAQGTLWKGSAQLIFSGGQGSHDAVALPGRVSWQLRPGLTTLTAQVNAACCTPQGWSFSVRPHWGGMTLHIGDAETHWPAALLSGLGTPWNTLQPDGDLRVSSQGLSIDVVQGRITTTGTAQIEARQMSSRLSTLRPMGSYRVSMTGGAVTAFRLETLEGALRLSGDGQWSAGTRLHFTGFATAEADREAALSNLLNIIGRRDGARSIITVG